MSLSLGIVGLPNVGKSTLFNALTRNNVVAANYPFATIEPNEGVVPLPDARLATLAEMFASERIVAAPVTFVDIAGLVAGASEGAGLGNKFLANIRECDAICQVVRVFADDDVTHVAGRVDPKSDIEVVETELILADLQTLERAVPRLEKEARNNKERKPLYDAALAAQQVLDGGTTLFAAGADALLLRELNLLTTKPFLYAFNADESVLTDADRVAELRALVSPADAVFLDAKIEAELTELDDESAAELLESIGQTERGLDALARAGFHTLKLQTYLTAGPKESRAWTIHQGDTAPKAAGVIHTDFEKGFIKAEIVSYDDLVAAGSMAAAKSAGKVRMEGKDYVMADGFHTLKLQTYLTAGPKESRAWTIHQGDTAPKAAGVIHTDFEKGFIKAEIVSYDDLVAAGSMAAAKSAGKVRMEGKDYVMADGDVVEFRFGSTSTSKG